MDQKEFLNLFFKSDHRRIIGNRFGQFKVSDIKDLKSLTSLINYDCQFKDGVCKSTKKPTCCCGGCENAVGYLTDISYPDIDTYAKLFDVKTGFWREDGCSLPRDLRSFVCLRQTCQSSCTDAEKDLFDLIRNLENEYAFQRDVIKYDEKYKLDPYYARLENLIKHLKHRLEMK